jgi:integrase/recombinase XerD
LIRYKQAAQKSEHTISDYRNSFSKLRLYFKDDPAFASLTRDKLVGFFAWLRADYESEPDGVPPRGKKKLSAKSVLNIHTNLSALWNWAVQEGYVKENFIRRIERPVVTDPVVEPLTREEIGALLKATDISRSWKTRELTTNARPTAVRDRAIIMALVDTGVRASELCGITYTDINFDHNSIKVRGKGPGGEGKERIVYFGKGCARQLWKYLLPRLDTIRPEDDTVARIPG